MRVWSLSNEHHQSDDFSFALSLSDEEWCCQERGLQIEVSLLALLEDMLDTLDKAFFDSHIERCFLAAGHLVNINIGPLDELFDNFRESFLCGDIKGRLMGIFTLNIWIDLKTLDKILGKLHMPSLTSRIQRTLLLDNRLIQIKPPA